MSKANRGARQAARAAEEICRNEDAVSTAAHVEAAQAIDPGDEILVGDDAWGVGLSLAQNRAIEALVMGKKITEAAVAAERHRNTVHRWLHQPEFCTALAAIRGETNFLTGLRTATFGDLANDCIEQALRSGNARFALQYLKALGAFKIPTPGFEVPQMPVAPEPAKPKVMTKHDEWVRKINEDSDKFCAEFMAQYNEAPAAVVPMERTEPKPANRGGRIATELLGVLGLLVGSLLLIVMLMTGWANQCCPLLRKGSIAALNHPSAGPLPTATTSATEEGDAGGGDLLRSKSRHCGNSRKTCNIVPHSAPPQSVG